jgi:hypothetical protein
MKLVVFSESCVPFEMGSAMRLLVFVEPPVRSMLHCPTPLCNDGVSSYGWVQQCQGLCLHQTDTQSF